MNENIPTDQESSVISKVFGMEKRTRMRRCGGQEKKRDRGGRGYGRMGGGCGVVGVCVCLKCGHQESHQRGNPCFQKKCPKCGESMVRGE